MLVYRRVTPSPPLPSRMPAVPFYTPEWREPQWSKVPYPLKEATRRDGRGLNPRPPYLLLEVLTARPHTILVVYQFHLQVQKKGRYPILYPIPWHSCLDLYPALTTPMRWVWLKTFFFLIDFTWRLSGESLGRAWGDRPPLFLGQTEDQRVEKKFSETAPPPYLRVWMTAAPTLSEGQGPSCSKGV